MKYSELARIRADTLFQEGKLTFDEWQGKSWPKDKYPHVCWFSVCVSERDDTWKCEVCGKWDDERKPYHV